MTGTGTGFIQTVNVSDPLSGCTLGAKVETSGDGDDKAGAYAVQGAGGALVEEVRGSVSNVVGLPLAETLSLLARLGFAAPWSARP